MPSNPHAVIVGASVAGLASACALAQAGWSVRVIERRPDLLEGGRAFLLQPNGLAALERLGVLGIVRKRALLVNSVCFYERDSRPAAVYDYSELRCPHAFALEIRPQALRLVLAERLAHLGAPPPRFSSRFAEVARRGVLIIGARCHHADGEEVELAADLVVGADGAGSAVRAALGIGHRQVGRSCSYVLGTVGAVRDTHDIEVHCGAGYANGVAPLPDGTYFWDCVTEANRPAIEARDLHRWRAAYERRVPKAGEFIDAIDSWEELTSVEVRPSWARRRLAPGAVLVGDAAGTVHPHSAQGANLALEDACLLGEALAAGPDSVDLPALSDYARRRHQNLRRYVLWSLAAAGSLEGRTRAWRAVRRWSFRSSAVGPVRRENLRRQAGLA